MVFVRSGASWGLMSSLMLVGYLGIAVVAAHTHPGMVLVGMALVGWFSIHTYALSRWLTCRVELRGGEK